MVIIILVYNFGKITTILIMTSGYDAPCFMVIGIVFDCYLKKNDVGTFPWYCNMLLQVAPLFLIALMLLLCGNGGVSF